MIGAMLAMIAMIGVPGSGARRPLVVWARKFRIEEGGAQDITTSWMLDSGVVIKARSHRRPWAAASPLVGSEARRAPRIAGRQTGAVFKASFPGPSWSVAPRTSTWRGSPCPPAAERTCPSVDDQPRIRCADARPGARRDDHRYALGPARRVIHFCRGCRASFSLSNKSALFSRPHAVSDGDLAAQVDGGRRAGQHLAHAPWNAVVHPLQRLPSQLDSAICERLPEATGFVPCRGSGSTDLPTVFPYLVTGWVTAAGGAWNASIVAEYVTFRGTVLSAPGLGRRSAWPPRRPTCPFWPLQWPPCRSSSWPSTERSGALATVWQSTGSLNLAA